jgi:hypothetical protein
MALRLKYAGFSEAGMSVEPRLEAALARATDAARMGGRVPVFLTYTAMLAARRSLQRHGFVLPLWED